MKTRKRPQPYEGEVYESVFTPIDEYEIEVWEPESMSVGKLNAIVRELRERNYQLRILLQRCEAEVQEGG